MVRSSRPAAPDDPDDEDAAERVAARILGGAAQTELSLRRRLELRGFSPAASRAAAQSLSRRGYVDDDAFARSVAERRLRSGHGRMRVAAELRARGCGERPIDEALRGTGMEEERAAALALGHRLHERSRPSPDAEPRLSRAALAGRLARRGYAPDTVAYVVRTITEGGDIP
ncbi:MAG: regulatory protein RecX [Chloroflexi bacterium]|nr:MAG: regulatory protein RecX [Chloroflexota bacterium]